MSSIYNHLTFPYKLYEALNFASRSEHSSVVSWAPNGQSFFIRNPATFMQHIVPVYFKLTRFRSFTRQLNIWGFKSYGRDGWINANFVRGNVKGLKFVQRVQAKSSSGDSSSTTTDRKSPASLSPPRSGGEASSNSGVDPPPDVSTSKCSSHRVLAASSHRQERTPDNSTQQQSEDDYFLSMCKILGLKDDTADECRCSFCRALKIGADWASISRLNQF